MADDIVDGVAGDACEAFVGPGDASIGIGEDGSVGGSLCDACELAELEIGFLDLSVLSGEAADSGFEDEQGLGEDDEEGDESE